MGVAIAATGASVPDQVVTNEDLRRTHGFDPDWIVQRTGIRERRYVAADEATSDLAVRAAAQCLERAGVAASEVDMLLVGTFTPDYLCPSTAALVQHKLGLRCGAVDLQAACAGFMYTLITGMQFIAAGTSKRCLVIGADCNSRILNPRDTKVYPLFGDGAGAVLLTPGTAEQGMLAYSLGADGGGCDFLIRRMGGSRIPYDAAADAESHFLHMDGKPVFKWAVRLVEENMRDVVRAADLSLEQLDLVLLHQANVRIIDGIADALGLAKSKVAIQLDRYGNTSAASIPLVLDECVRQGRVARGNHLLMSGFGAGLAWGTGVWKW
ncbi:MAG: ketoacyl-ACP synthase III [Planctomycetia bacterium]|nr:ketoacyl-ACP synthase III [Planctomycetia bacterium]